MKQMPHKVLIDLGKGEDAKELRESICRPLRRWGYNPVEVVDNKSPDGSDSQILKSEIQDKLKNPDNGIKLVIAGACFFPKLLDVFRCYRPLEIIPSAEDNSKRIEEQNRFYYFNKPILFLVTEPIDELYEDELHGNRKLLKTLGIDKKWGIIDYDIWHSCLKLPQNSSELLDLVDEICKSEAYESAVAVEHLEHTLRTYYYDRIHSFGVGGHGEWVEPEYVPKTWIRSELSSYAKRFQWDNEKKIRLTMIDDFAENPLRKAAEDGDICKSKQAFLKDIRIKMGDSDRKIEDLFEIDPLDTPGKGTSWVTQALEKIGTASRKSISCDGQNEPSLILMDYLFTLDPSAPLVPKQPAETAIQIIKKLGDPEERSNREITGDVHWIFFISCFPEKVMDEIHRNVIPLFHHCMRIHPGADLISTPDLFVWKLLSFLYDRLTFRINECSSRIQNFQRKLKDQFFSGKAYCSNSMDRAKCRLCLEKTFTDLMRFRDAYEGIEEEKKDVLSLHINLSHEGEWKEEFDKIELNRNDLKPFKRIVDLLASALRHFLWAPESDWVPIRQEIDDINVLGKEIGLTNFSCSYILKELKRRSKIY